MVINAKLRLGLKISVFGSTRNFGLKARYGVIGHSVNSDAQAQAGGTVISQLADSDQAVACGATATGTGTRGSGLLKGGRHFKEPHTDYMGGPPPPRWTFSRLDFL